MSRTSRVGTSRTWRAEALRSVARRLSAATGIAALLSASAAAFTVVKVAGAAYLGRLGIRSLRGTIAWFLLVATIVGTLRKVFTRPGVRRAVDALTGVTLIARLATSSRP